jgi:predicted ester cyclase
VKAKESLTLEARYRDYIAALNAGRFEDATQFYAAKVWFNDQAFTRDQFRDLVLTLGRQIAPDTQITIESPIINGDDLAARIVRTGTQVKAWMGIPPTGASARLREYAFYHFKNGACERVWSVLDLGPLLGAFGVGHP